MRAGIVGGFTWLDRILDIVYIIQYPPPLRVTAPQRPERVRTMARFRVQPLHEHVAHWIREMIRKGDLNKGDRIIEKDLCASFGISRTPLREALRCLTSEGLIRIVPHRGAYVAEPSMDEIREMFEVMKLLEGNCAAMAAEKISESDLVKLEKLHEKLEKHYKANQHEKYLDVNQKFHTMLQEMAGNKVLNDVVNGLRQKIVLYRYRQLYQADRFEASIREHRAIMDALRRRDPAASESLMREHLMNQCEALKNLYEGKAERKAATKP